RHLGEVDDVGSNGNRQRFSDSLDLIIANENDLIVEDSGGIGIDQMSGFDGGDLGRERNSGKDTECEKQAEGYFQSPPYRSFSINTGRARRPSPHQKCLLVSGRSGTV